VRGHSITDAADTSDHDGWFGMPSDRVFDDLDVVDELTSLPDNAFHRNVDKIVLECGTRYENKVRTAVVCPPTIYGNASLFSLSLGCAFITPSGVE
jgi:hypothetical protein